PQYGSAARAGHPAMPALGMVGVGGADADLRAAADTAAGAAVGTGRGVAAIASRGGFTNFGRFAAPYRGRSGCPNCGRCAAAYRARYGRTPSETLRRAR